MACEGFMEKAVLQVGLSNSFTIYKKGSCSQKEVYSSYFPPNVKFPFCQVVFQNENSSKQTWVKSFSSNLKDQFRGVRYFF